MARNALATTARAVKATAGQWLVLFFLTFVLACPAISMAADAAATAPAAQTNVVTVADAQDTAVTPSPVAATTGDVQTAQVVDDHPWWFWPVALLFFCFILGIIAVMAGVGGGVLFVPLVSGFFPFHLDFVRGAGLLVALAGALPVPVCCAVTSPTCVWPCPWPSSPRPAPSWAPCWAWPCPPTSSRPALA